MPIPEQLDVDQVRKLLGKPPLGKVPQAVGVPSLGLNTSVPGRHFRTVRFVVDHEPMGAPRMTQQDKWQKRPSVIAYRSFKDAIREAAPEIIPADTVYSLSFVAYFSPPESKARELIGALHRQKPDIDNVCKSVMDALFEKDAAIAKVSMEKRWRAIPGLEIEIQVFL